MENIENIKTTQKEHFSPDYLYYMSCVNQHEPDEIIDDRFSMSYRDVIDQFIDKEDLL